MRQKGGSKKGRRSARNKTTGVYLRQRARTTARKHRNAIKRKNAIEFFKTHPHSGSPSQIRSRGLGYVPAKNKLPALRMLDAIAAGEIKMTGGK